MTNHRESSAVVLKAIFVAVFFAFYSTGLAAQGNASDEAKQKFQDARTLFNEGLFAEAAALFRTAYELAPSWKILYNIGQSEAAARHYGLALDAFEAYLANGGDDIPADREEEVTAEILKLKTRVGSLRVVAPEGAEVFIDDFSRGKAPFPGKIRTSAGIKQKLVVRRGDRVLLEREILLGSDEVLDITLTDDAPPAAALSPAAVATPTPEESKDPSSETPSEGVSRAPAPDDRLKPLAVTGWTLVGVGIAALIGGGITGGLAISKSSELEDSCGGTTCSPDDKTLWDSANTVATVSTVLIPVGATLAATGIVLLIVHRKKSESGRVAVSPLVTHESAGLIFRGRF